MKLQPYHFQTPERPKEEDYNFGYDPVIDAQYYGAAMDEFQKALAEWESLYGEEPQPEWIDYKKQKPEVDQLVYTKQRGRPVLNALKTGLLINRMTKPFMDNWGHCIEAWIDKSDYDKKIEDWKDHQVRYPGWKFEQSSYQNFVKDGVAITFIDNDRIIIADTLERYDIYQGPCSTKLFELICEENEIELCLD